METLHWASLLVQFSNIIIFQLKVFTFFRHNAITLLIDYSVV